MKIVVTGGSGRLGRHVVQELLAHDYQVLSLDRVPPLEQPCPTWAADLTRAGDCYQSLEGAGGVVHLAAYQAPNLAPDTETFGNNVTSTYNVLKAAADLGIARVVLASSVAAYGFIYASRFQPPEYLPLDEDHPCLPQDPYGLSKIVGEQIADSFARSNPEISVLSLRLPGINFDLTYRNFPDRWRDPGGRRLGGFWSYIDARDAAAACRVALEGSLRGHHIFNIAAPRSTMPEPTEDLVRRYVPGIGRVKSGLSGNWSGLDSTRAERILGFRAQHAWEQYLMADGQPRS